jgi:thiol-disulfide isomerase/thioredoxin
MKKTMCFIVLVVASILLGNKAMAQDYIREIDPKTGHPLLRGQIEFADLLHESTCAWLGAGSASYKANTQAIENIQKLGGPYRYIVFAGTWCEDTQILLPQFYALMQQAGIPKSAVLMYGLNRAKKALNQEEVVFDVTRVPTIIVLEQNREIGRITETSSSSVEQDIADMMLKDKKVLDNRKAARGL